MSPAIIMLFIDCLVVTGELTKQQADQAADYLESIPVGMKLTDYMEWRHNHVK